jgi:hypothetical protein
MEDAEFKERALAVGYPVKVFDVLESRGLKRTGHTLFESPYYPASVTVLLSAVDLSVYFGTSRAGLIPKMMGLFEKHQPTTWDWEKDNSYFRYWFPETKSYQSCSEEKWIQSLDKTVADLLH